MPETNSQAPATEVVQTDAFGEPVKVHEADVVETPAADVVVDEAKLTPTERMTKMAEEIGTFKAEKTSSEALHKKKDEDIRAMADKIKRLEAGSGGAPEGGKTQEGDVPFKEIKTSKDLTDDEKDDMTDAEIKALDEKAVLKETINQQARDLAASKGGNGGTVDVNQSVREQAVELAENDADLANKIIDAFNGAKFNTKDMTAEEIEKAVALVAGTVTGYKAPKEDAVRPGGGRPAVNGTKDDPHGINKIVAQVAKQTTSDSYQL